MTIDVRATDRNGKKLITIPVEGREHALLAMQFLKLAILPTRPFLIAAFAPGNWKPMFEIHYDEETQQWDSMAPFREENS
jgi:hypothetical protein